MFIAPSFFWYDGYERRICFEMLKEKISYSEYLLQLSRQTKFDLIHNKGK